MRVVAFTGIENIGELTSKHNAEIYQTVRELIREQLDHDFYVDVMTNLEPGIGELVYMAAISLKNEYNHRITIHLILPTKDDRAFSIEQNLKRDKYFELSDKIKSVGQTMHSPELVLKSNKYMREHSDIMYTIWDNTRGNTQAYLRDTITTTTTQVNCIDYNENKVYELTYADFIIKELLG